jgi:hypothetical protein
MVAALLIKLVPLLVALLIYDETGDASCGNARIPDC